MIGNIEKSIKILAWNFLFNMTCVILKDYFKNVKENIKMYIRLNDCTLYFPFFYGIYTTNYVNSHKVSKRRFIEYFISLRTK